MKINYVSLITITLIALIGGYLQINPFICFSVGFTFGWCFPIIERKSDEAGE